MQAILRVLLCVALVGCARAGRQPQASAGGAGHADAASAGPAPVDASLLRTLKSGVQTYDITVGTGQMPVQGQRVEVYYEGWLESGEPLSSTVRDDKPPLAFRVGAPGMIEGWQIGIADMRVGGKRRLVVPPEHAYGKKGRAPAVPENATLIFDIELVGLGDIRIRPEQPDVDLDTDARTTSMGDWVRGVDLKYGTGPLVQERSGARVEMSIWDEAGEVFFSTYDRDIAQHYIIGGEPSRGAPPLTGLDTGLRGMAAGGERYLEIAPEAAFGETGMPPKMPPNSTIYALVQVVEVTAPRIAPDVPTAFSPSAVTTTESGLGMLDLEFGTGPGAAPTDQLTIEYTGWLQDGTRFDSTYERASPFQMELGRQHVIKALEEGLIGMQVGGKRILVVPPDLAYGERQHGRIPEKSVLTFEIELVKIEPKGDR